MQQQAMQSARNVSAKLHKGVQLGHTVMEMCSLADTQQKHGSRCNVGHLGCLTACLKVHTDTLQGEGLDGPS